MSDDFNEWTKLVLDEMKRFDQNHRDVMGGLEKIKEKQVEQGKTLIRNTSSLEEHMRRTDLLEQKTENIEGQVQGLKDHVNNVKLILNILKPTKMKITIISFISSLIGGAYIGPEKIIEFILKLFS
jgi:hypothetical protein